jgi:hypothetical protein
MVGDALGVPELTAALLAQLSGSSVPKFTSYLDIDIAEQLELHGPDWQERPHLILLGGGDVNCITGRLFEYYMDQGVPVRPGPEHPHQAEFIGAQGRKYTTAVNPGAGLLIALANPFWRGRFAVICAGINAIGTVAASWLLNEYVSGRGGKYGDNAHTSSTPAKIVLGTPARYPKVDLHHPDDTVPKNDLRNLSTADSSVQVVE